MIFDAQKRCKNAVEFPYAFHPASPAIISHNQSSRVTTLTQRHSYLQHRPYSAFASFISNAFFFFPSGPRVPSPFTCDVASIFIFLLKHWCLKVFRSVILWNALQSGFIGCLSVRAAIHILCRKTTEAMWSPRRHVMVKCLTAIAI